MPHPNCTHACEARGAVLARGAVARGAVARGAVRGVPCAGCLGGDAVAAGHKTLNLTVGVFDSCFAIVRML